MNKRRKGITATNKTSQEGDEPLTANVGCKVFDVTTQQSDKEQKTPKASCIPPLKLDTRTCDLLGVWR